MCTSEVSFTSSFLSSMIWGLRWNLSDENSWVSMENLKSPIKIWRPPIQINPTKTLGVSNETLGVSNKNIGVSNEKCKAWNETHWVSNQKIEISDDKHGFQWDGRGVLRWKGVSDYSTPTLMISSETLNKLGLCVILLIY